MARGQTPVRLNSRIRSREHSRSRSREFVTGRFPACGPSYSPTWPDSDDYAQARGNCVYVDSSHSSDSEPGPPRQRRRRLTLYSSSDESIQSPGHSTPSPLYEVEHEPQLYGGYKVEHEPQLDEGHEVEEAPLLENAVVLSKPDVLDCIICLDHLTPPVYECVEGHLACGSCSYNHDNLCPSCYKPIGNNRCRGIEKVLESAISPCRNRERGCQVKVIYGKILEHEKSCEYALWPCPHDECACYFYARKLEDFNIHFSSLHSNSVRYFLINVSKTILLQKDTDRVFLQERYGSTVFVLNRLNDPLGSLISVICLGPTSLRANYTYKLKARAGHKKICLRSHVDVTLDCRSRQPLNGNGLLVTSDFGDHLERLELQLLIRRSDEMV